MTGDRTPLRERLVETLVAHARRDTRDKQVKLSSFLETVIRAGAESRADAVLPVVEAETAALRERAEQAERRAEHFEEHAAQINADLGIETQRAEEAEAAVERVRRLQELTIAASCRVEAINQARDTLRVLEPPKETR